MSFDNLSRTVNGLNANNNRSTMKEMVGGCCVCSDERGWDENPLVYCDGHGCNVAVHQGTLATMSLERSDVIHVQCYTYTYAPYCC